MTPLVSIVIPTATRPRYLPRAVDSAMAGMEPGEVEVIVVPNGLDESWRESLKPFRKINSVRILRIPKANANIARNVGMVESKGVFIRFLDDDDYLIPTAALKQYELIKDSGADVISGSVQLVDSKDRCFEVWNQPKIDDFCAAMIGPWRVCLPPAHVYRRSSIKNVKWNPKTSVRQDVEWSLNLCASSDLHWIKIEDIVGTWQHHWQPRISSSNQFNMIRKLTASMIIKTYEDLKKRGRLNETRQRATALGLWGCVHASFFLEPNYWTHIARLARQLEKTIRPQQVIYNLPIFRTIDPLTIQWIMFPKRFIHHRIRQLFKKRKIRHFW